MAYGFGGGGGGGSGGGTGGAGQGYGYATLSSSIDAGDADGRTCRSHTVTRFSRGYSVLTNGRPKVDRRYSPPAQTGSRHRAGTGPSTTLYSALQSGLALPRSVFSKSSTDIKTTVDSSKKPAQRSNRRRSTGSRPEPPNYRASETQKLSTSRKSGEEEKTPGLFSFSSMASRTSIASLSSKKSSSSRKDKENKNKNKKKPSYGMWSCFG